MLTTRNYAIALLGLVLAASGCAQKSDIEAVQTTQKEILAKLEKIEKDLAARPAAQQAAARPPVDPNKVYDIPVDQTAIRGPNCRLAIAKTGRQVSEAITLFNVSAAMVEAGVKIPKSLKMQASTYAYTGPTMAVGPVATGNGSLNPRPERMDLARCSYSRAKM